MNSISVFLDRFNTNTSSSLKKSILGICAVTGIAALVFASRRALTRHPLTPNGERVILNGVNGPIPAASPTARAPLGAASATAPRAAAPATGSVNPDSIDRLIASNLRPETTMGIVMKELTPSCTSIEHILSLYYQVLNKPEYFFNDHGLTIEQHETMIRTIETQLERMIQRFEEKVRSSINNTNDKNNQRIAVIGLIKELNCIDRPELKENPHTQKFVERLQSIKNNLNTSLRELIPQIARPAVSVNRAAIDGLIRDESPPQRVMQTVINDLIPGCTSLKEILDLSYEVLNRWEYFFNDVQSVHNGLTSEEHSTMLAQIEQRYANIAQSFQERVNSVANHPDDKNHQRNTLLALIKELDCLDRDEFRKYPQIQQAVQHLKDKREQMMIGLIKLEEEIERGLVENGEEADRSLLNDKDKSLNRHILEDREQNERRILEKDETTSLSSLKIQESWESQLRQIRELESRGSFDLANEMKNSLRNELNPRELPRINHLDHTLGLRQVRRDILRALT